jgi:hypothetical protein
MTDLLKRLQDFNDGNKSIFLIIAIACLSGALVDLIHSRRINYIESLCSKK